MWREVGVWVLEIAGTLVAPSVCLHSSWALASLPPRLRLRVLPALRTPVPAPVFCMPTASCFPPLFLEAVLSSFFPGQSRPGGRGLQRAPSVGSALLGRVWSARGPADLVAEAAEPRCVLAGRLCSLTTRILSQLWGPLYCLPPPGHTWLDCIGQSALQRRGPVRTGCKRCGRSVRPSFVLGDH